MALSQDLRTCFFFFNDTATTEIYTLSYTTLFRSPRECRGVVAHQGAWRAARLEHSPDFESGGRKDRSEEHTSELQSRLHLVCRPLLEKKKLRLAHVASGPAELVEGSADAPVCSLT